MIAVTADNYTVSAAGYKRFDVVEYIKKLRKAGISQEAAEVQGQELGHVIEDVLKQAKQESHEIFDSKELATKGDLEKTKLVLQNEIMQVKLEIEQVKLELQKEIEQVRLEISQVRAEIHKSKYDVVIWVAGMFIASGLIQHFLK